jgi:hypothetical protein
MIPRHIPIQSSQPARAQKGTMRRWRRCPASIPLLCLLLLGGASCFKGGDGSKPFPRTAAAAAAVAPSGAMEWAGGAEEVLSQQQQQQQRGGEGRALLMDEEAEGEEFGFGFGEEEEEELEVVEEEEAPPCGGFPTFMWGGKPSYFGGQGVYETRRWV